MIARRITRVSYRLPALNSAAFVSCSSTLSVTPLVHSSLPFDRRHPCCPVHTFVLHVARRRTIRTMAAARRGGARRGEARAEARRDDSCASAASGGAVRSTQHKHARGTQYNTTHNARDTRTHTQLSTQRRRRVANGEASSYIHGVYTASRRDASLRVARTRDREMRCPIPPRKCERAKKSDHRDLISSNAFRSDGRHVAATGYSR